MPKQNEALRRLLNYCDDSAIDIGEVQAVIEASKAHEMNDKVKVYSFGLSCGLALLAGAFWLFQANAAANQALLSVQDLKQRTADIERAMQQTQIAQGKQDERYQQLQRDLSEIKANNNQIIQLLTTAKK